MSTLVKIIVSTILSFVFLSCNFDVNSGKRGNGQVTTEERPINEAFSKIEVSEGLDVYLTQSDNVEILVETDENLQSLILTEIKNGVLKIHTKEKIGRPTAKKVSVSFKTISEIESSSGSDIYGTNTLFLESLNLTSSSGSDIEIDVNTNALQCIASSGSDIEVSGKTNSLFTKASSGSSIKAIDLLSQITEARASSGADITVNTSKNLTADASSGGDVKYYGNPEKVEKSNNPSGSIQQK